MAGNNKESVKVMVEIFGEEYAVRGAEDPQYIQLLGDKLDRRMRTLYQKSPNLNVSKLAILTAINLIDELSKLQEDYDQLVKLLEEKRRTSNTGMDSKSRRNAPRQGDLNPPRQEDLNPPD